MTFAISDHSDKGPACEAYNSYQHVEDLGEIVAKFSEKTNLSLVNGQRFANLGVMFKPFAFLLLSVFLPFQVSAAAEAPLPIVTVESEYIDAKTQERLTMSGQGFIVDMFGTKVIISASHLTQGGVMQNKSNKLKASYIAYGRVKPLKINMQITDNMEDIVLLFSKDLESLPALATARYKGPQKITRFADLSSIARFINYQHKNFEFPLNPEYRELFSDRERLLKHFYPIGKTLFTRCPLTAAEFCARNPERLHQLARAEVDAEAKGAVMAAKIFARGYHMAESEGIFFKRVLNGMSGQPIISLEKSADGVVEPRVIGVITASSLVAEESWFAPLGYAGYLSGTLPAAVRNDPNREGYLINNVYWQLVGGFVARYADIYPLGFGFAESRPRDNTGNGTRADNGNGIRGDNTVSQQTAFHLRTPPVLYSPGGPSLSVFGFHIWGHPRRPEDFRVLPATLGGLKREVRTWQIDTALSGRSLPPRYAHEQMDGHPRNVAPITKHWTQKYGSAKPQRVELKMDHVHPESMVTAHGPALASLEISAERPLKIRVRLEFAGEVIDETAHLSALLEVRTDKGRQCVLETGGLIFENPDRLEQFDSEFKTAFLLVCGAEHYYFYIPREEETKP